MWIFNFVVFNKEDKFCDSELEKNKYMFKFFVVKIRKLRQKEVKWFVQRNIDVTWKQKMKNKI